MEISRRGTSDQDPGLAGPWHLGPVLPTPVEQALELVKPGKDETSPKRPFWSPKLSFKGAAAPEAPGQRLSRALKSQDPAGFASRIGRPSFIELKPSFSEDELASVIDETYRQLPEPHPSDG